MDSSSSDLDFEVLPVINSAAEAVITPSEAKSTNGAKFRGGSQLRCAKNRNFDVLAKCDQLDRDLFFHLHFSTPLFTVGEPARTYRITRYIYEKMRSDLVEHEDFSNGCRKPLGSVAQARTSLCTVP